MTLKQYTVRQIVVYTCLSFSCSASTSGCSRVLLALSSSSCLAWLPDDANIIWDPMPCSKKCWLLSAVGGSTWVRLVGGLEEVALDSWVAKGDRPTTFLGLLGRRSDEEEPGEVNELVLDLINKSHWAPAVLRLAVWENVVPCAQFLHKYNTNLQTKVYCWREGLQLWLGPVGDTQVTQQMQS